MASRKNVTPAEVRTWLQGEKGQKAIADYNAKADAKDVVTTYVGPRGQFQPVHRDLFRKGNPGKDYVVGLLRETPRDFKHFAVDSKGRKRTATTSLTLSEARALIGDTGKGRLDNQRVIDTLAANAGYVAPVEASTPKPDADDTAKDSGAVAKS